MKLLIFLLHILPAIIGTTTVVTTYIVYRFLNFRWLLNFTFFLFSLSLLSVSLSIYYILIQFNYFSTDNIVLIYRITQNLLLCLWSYSAMAFVTEFLGQEKTQDFRKIIYSAIVVMLIVGVIGLLIENQFLFICSRVLVCLIFINLQVILFIHRKELYLDQYKKFYTMLMFLSIYTVPLNLLIFILTNYSKVMNLRIPALSIHCLIIYTSITIFNLNLIQKLLRKMRQNDPELRPEFIDNFSISNRESQVMGYLVKGFNQKLIAEKLSISHRTVENYVYKIYKKCGVKNIQELMSNIKSDFWL